MSELPEAVRAKCDEICETSGSHCSDAYIMAELLMELVCERCGQEHGNGRTFTQPCSNPQAGEITRAEYLQRHAARPVAGGEIA